MCNQCCTPRRSDVGEWIPNELIKPEETKYGLLRKTIKLLEASLSLVIAVIIPAAIVYLGYVIFDLPFKG